MHEKIYVAQTSTHLSPEQTMQKLQALMDAARGNERMRIVKALGDLVPTYAPGPNGSPSAARPQAVQHDSA